MAVSAAALLSRALRRPIRGIVASVLAAQRYVAAAMFAKSQTTDGGEMQCQSVQLGSPLAQCGWIAAREYAREDGGSLHRWEDADHRGVHAVRRNSAGPL